MLRCTTTTGRCIHCLATLAGLCLQYGDGGQVAIIILLLHNALCRLLRLLLLLLLNHFGWHCLDNLLPVGLLQL